MNKEEIKNLVTEMVQNDPDGSKIRSIALFGSFLHGDTTPESDIDLIIEMAKPIGLFTFVGIKQNLEAKLGRPVDLVTPNGLSHYIRDKVLSEAEVIYG